MTLKDIIQINDDKEELAVFLDSVRLYPEDKDKYNVRAWDVYSEKEVLRIFPSVNHAGRPEITCILKK